MLSLCKEHSEQPAKAFLSFHFMSMFKKLYLRNPVNFFCTSLFIYVASLQSWYIILVKLINCHLF